MHIYQMALMPQAIAYFRPHVPVVPRRPMSPCPPAPEADVRPRSRRRHPHAQIAPVCCLRLVYLAQTAPRAGSAHAQLNELRPPHLQCPKRPSQSGVSCPPSATCMHRADQPRRTHARRRATPMRNITSQTHCPAMQLLRSISTCLQMHNIFRLSALLLRSMVACDAAAGLQRPTAAGCAWMDAWGMHRMHCMRARAWRALLLDPWQERVNAWVAPLFATTLQQPPLRGARC